jgi:paraquat-inducible protein A
MNNFTWLIKPMLVLSLVLLIVGLFAPLMTFRQFFIFTDTVSLLDAMWLLLEDGHPWLFALVVLFSIVFPVFKLIILFISSLDMATRHHRVLLGWIARYGKWSMLDVFIVAVVIVSIRMETLADATVHYGLYAFAASIILSMLTTSLVVRTLQYRSRQT